MKIVALAALLVLPLAAPAGAEPVRPTAPKPCVLMPRQGGMQATAPRPRDGCASAAFPRF